MNLLSWRNISWVSLALCLVFATAASANIIGPGGSGAPDMLSPSGIILADTGIETFTTGPFLSGTTREIVITDSITGDLDFIFAIHNDSTSTDGIGRSTTAAFTGYLTDVGYNPLSTIDLLGFVSTIIPTTVDRSFAGDTIGFNFGILGFPPGASSFDLIIETNATQFSGGILNFIDGGVAQVPGFAPSPEPASLALMGAGIVFCARLLRRKKKTAEAAITA